MFSFALKILLWIVIQVRKTSKNISVCPIHSLGLYTLLGWSKCYTTVVVLQRVQEPLQPQNTFCITVPRDALTFVLEPRHYWEVLLETKEKEVNILISEISIFVTGSIQKCTLEGTKSLANLFHWYHYQLLRSCSQHFYVEILKIVLATAISSPGESISYTILTRNSLFCNSNAINSCQS